MLKLVKDPLFYFPGLLTYLILFIRSLFSLYSVNTKERNLLYKPARAQRATVAAWAARPINKFLDEKSETDIKDYIEQFFVGLLEGDGTITVDFVSSSKRRVRIFIALKNIVFLPPPTATPPSKTGGRGGERKRRWNSGAEENKFMLNLIEKYVGGRVVIERNNKYVTWYATSKTDTAKVFAILAKYPLLSTRKLCQLEFAKYSIISRQDIPEEEFIKLRDNKYKNQEAMLD